jgi:polyphosphate kinase
MSTVKGKSKAAHVADKAAVSELPAELGPARFYNRELSWLQFNRRVLEEARNENHPLLERLRFLSISASNLDEFYMVRAAGIYGQIAAGVTTTTQDGLTPAEQMAAINTFAAALVADKQAIWRSIRTQLDASGLKIVEPEDLTDRELVWVENLFLTHIFPILTPIAVDPAHPFPFILNKGLTIAVQLQNRADGKVMSGLIPIPSQLERFIRLRAELQSEKQIRFIQLEQLIGMFLEKLFMGFEVKAKGAFRLLRDSDIELQEEAEDLVRSYETLLKRRRRGVVIRLELESRMPEQLRRLVADELEVGEEAIFVKDGVLGLSDTSQLLVSDRPDLLFKPFNIRFPERIREFNGDQQKGHRRPSPLRKLRRRGAVPAPGRQRSQRNGDQMDALSHVARQPHRTGIEGSR